MTLPNKRISILAAALAATTVSAAWAAYQHNSTYVPAVIIEAPPAVTANEAVIVVDERELIAKESEARVQESETIAAPQPVDAPARPAAHPAPAITITEPRLTADQRIQADVIDLLARNPNLSGKIGVVSEDRVVTLTGYTSTSGQAWRAGRDARGVVGVRHVVNEIRPRVGGITS